MTRMWRSGDGRGDDRGSATVTACFAMLALMSVTAVVVHLGAAVVARHRAQAAADLGALAAAATESRGDDGACAAAGTVVRRMGASVQDCRLQDRDTVLVVVVSVATGTGSATAAARAGPVVG